MSNNLTAEELRSKGVKEIFPGVFEISLRTDINIVKTYNVFNEFYGNYIELLRKEREINERKAEKKLVKEGPLYFN